MQINSKLNLKLCNYLYTKIVFFIRVYVCNHVSFNKWTFTSCLLKTSMKEYNQIWFNKMSVIILLLEMTSFWRVILNKISQPIDISSVLKFLAYSQDTQQKKINSRDPKIWLMEQGHAKLLLLEMLTLWLIYPINE